MLKKIKNSPLVILFFGALILLFVLIGCTSSFRGDRIIHVVVRNKSSGTRTALESMLYGSSAKPKLPKGDAYEIVGGEAAVMASVRSNPQAIGYEGLGFVSSNLSGINILSIDGVSPSLGNLQNGTYRLSRPLNLVYRTDRLSSNLSAQKFLEFVHSKQGLQVIKQFGFALIVAESSAPEYHPMQNLSGEVRLAGSTTVEPLVQRLASAFKTFQPGVNTDNIHATGSGASVIAMQNNTHDFGMYSAVVSDETLKEMQSGSGNYSVNIFSITMDAIVMIVHKSNLIGNVTVEQLRHLYSEDSGKVFASWDDMINWQP